jgi:hypothetical protein
MQAQMLGVRFHPEKGVRVHAQLHRDRSDPPAFSVVRAQGLHLDVRRNRHGEVLFESSTDLGSAAESRGAQAANNDGRSGGSAIAAD